jgi:hypothetical protein
MGQQMEQMFLGVTSKLDVVFSAVLGRLETSAPAGPAPTKAELVSEGVEPSSELSEDPPSVSTEQVATAGAARSAIEKGPGLDVGTGLLPSVPNAAVTASKAKDVEFEEAEPDSTLPTDLPNRPPKNIWGGGDARSGMSEESGTPLTDENLSLAAADSGAPLAGSTPKAKIDGSEPLVNPNTPKTICENLPPLEQTLGTSLLTDGGDAPGLFRIGASASPPEYKKYNTSIPVNLKLSRLPALVNVDLEVELGLLFVPWDPGGRQKPLVRLSPEALYQTDTPALASVLRKTKNSPYAQRLVLKPGGAFHMVVIHYGAAAERSGRRPKTLLRTRLFGISFGDEASRHGYRCGAVFLEYSSRMLLAAKV